MPESFMLSLGHFFQGEAARPQTRVVPLWERTPIVSKLVDSPFLERKHQSVRQLFDEIPPKKNATFMRGRQDEHPPPPTQEITPLGGSWPVPPPKALLPPVGCKRWSGARRWCAPDPGSFSPWSWMIDPGRSWSSSERNDGTPPVVRHHGAGVPFGGGKPCKKKQHKFSAMQWQSKTTPGAKPFTAVTRLQITIHNVAGKQQPLAGLNIT